MCSSMCITVRNTHMHTHAQLCADLCGSPVCAEKKDFLQMEQCLGLCRRLMMNCAFIILLTHLSAVSVVAVICFASTPPPPSPFIKKTVFIYFIQRCRWCCWEAGLKEVGTKVIKGRKKRGWGGRGRWVYYKVSSIRKASEWMYGRRVAASRL